MTPTLQAAMNIMIAALGGAAVGVERERSGHASGPNAHFAGVRTFTMLGGLAGTAGWLWNINLQLPAVVLLVGATALVVVAYAAVSQRELDGTTEVAALVVLAAGLGSGTGHLGLASGVIALTTLILVEKSRLHAIVASIDDAGLRAGLRFAVMAVVVLPLLPKGPYGPFGGVRPQELWLMVLFFSGLSFAGYVARRLAGAERGYLVAGLLGGIISSTSVAFSFARASRDEQESGVPLALGVIGACTVMYVRVMIAIGALNPALVTPLLPYLAAPFLVGILAIMLGMRGRQEMPRPLKPPANPLQFVTALQMAGIFQVVLFAVHVAHNVWGQAGVLASGAVLGLADMDALVISMIKSAPVEVSLGTAAQAIAIGALSNTLMKLTLGLALGRAPFRRQLAGGLIASALASAVMLAWLR
jgi:uncharacterized membrane protein (DUF4010 family)